MSERDSGLRLALWRLHLDHHHAAVTPINDARGEPIPIDAALAEALSVHATFHQRAADQLLALPQRHSHKDHACGGQYLPRGPRPPCPYECDTCGAQTHASACVDDEGDVSCVCGLDVEA